MSKKVRCIAGRFFRIDQVTMTLSSSSRYSTSSTTTAKSPSSQHNPFEPSMVQPCAISSKPSTSTNNQIFTSSLPSAKFRPWCPASTVHSRSFPGARRLGSLLFPASPCYMSGTISTTYGRSTFWPSLLLRWRTSHFLPR
ncbi:hypothetical protein ARMSODRAFT_162537 [Armillaria solidipes]|uniref:Uncharacterized protein n=1 Tax=Armillaria solidipes TaxID=1076256 RepID=A0A2H3BXV0_9AGAR|nr:hypothetical protein ARMSODRAFT_162537 [Armillaria solidipes]